MKNAPSMLRSAAYLSFVATLALLTACSDANAEEKKPEEPTTPTKPKPPVNPITGYSVPGFDADAYFTKLHTADVPSYPSMTWQQFGPGMSGNNKSAFWHPTEAQTLYIAPNMGNCYISEDAGHTYDTMLAYDAPGYKTGLRGPITISSMDFSRQDAAFGFCTDEKSNGIFVTYDKGRSWENPAHMLKIFDNHYLSSVTVDPTNDDIWYVGAGKMSYLGRILFTQAKPHGTYTDSNSQKLVWRTNDGGATWKVINSGMHSKAEVQSIIVDPVHSEKVYMSTNYGFYTSDNHGDTWTKRTIEKTDDVVRSMVMHHKEGSEDITLYTLCSVEWEVDGESIKDKSGGVFRSTDRGRTWENINGDLALDMSHFQTNYSVKNSYYNPVSHYFGITKEEAMQSYPKLPKSLTQRYTQISVDPNDKNNLYLINMYSNASRNNFMPGQMWRSEDGGQHWYVCFRNGKNWDTGEDIDFWSARNNPLGTNITIQYMHDWVARDAYDRKSCNFAKFSCDGKVLHAQMAKISFMSYDKGKTWVDIDDVNVEEGSETYVGAGNSNLPGHGFYQHPDVKNKVFCCGGENSLWITAEGGDEIRNGALAATSNNILGTESSLSCYAIHPTNTDYHYAMFFRQASKGKLMRSTDGGVNWHEHGIAVPYWDIASYSGDQSVHQLGLTFCPSNPDHMYFVVPKNTLHMEYVGNSVTAFGVHYSSDGGATWEEMNDGLPNKPDASSICFDPEDPTHVYCTVQYEDGGLYETYVGQKTWTKVASPTIHIGDMGATDLHFSRDGKAYLATGGRRADADQGGLFVSTDGLKNWTKIFDYPWVQRVETARYNNNIILISCLAPNNIDKRNAGMYLSRDAGKSWVKINQGNGQSDRVNDIAIDNCYKGRYYASTYGSGWYFIQDDIIK